AAADIDGSLARHEAIQETKTIGIFDETMGERIHTACVPKPHRAVTSAELHEWARKGLSEHKWPDKIWMMGYLPKSAHGTVSADALRGILSGHACHEVFAALNGGNDRRAQPSNPRAI